MQVTDVQREVHKDERKIHCKSVELPLNYHERIIRYTFRVPPRTGEHGERLNDAEWLQKCRRYLNKWMDLIIAEKKRQLHLPEHTWPPWPPQLENIRCVHDAHGDVAVEGAEGEEASSSSCCVQPLW